MYADFITMDTNLLTCPDDAILSAKVLSTYVGGQLVYKK